MIRDRGMRERLDAGNVAAECAQRSISEFSALERRRISFCCMASESEGSLTTGEHVALRLEGYEE
jgi:hypothetical protein